MNVRFLFHTETVYSLHDYIYCHKQAAKHTFSFIAIFKSEPEESNLKKFVPLSVATVPNFIIFTSIS